MKRKWAPASWPRRSSEPKVPTITNARMRMKATYGGNSNICLPVVAPAKTDRTPTAIPIFQVAAARIGNNGSRNGTLLNRASSQMPTPIPAHVAHP